MTREYRKPDASSAGHEIADLLGGDALWTVQRGRGGAQKPEQWPAAGWFVRRPRIGKNGSRRSSHSPRLPGSWPAIRYRIGEHRAGQPARHTDRLDTGPANGILLMDARTLTAAATCAQFSPMPHPVLGRSY